MCVCACCVVMAVEPVEALLENRKACRICALVCRNCGDTSMLVGALTPVSDHVLDWHPQFARVCDFRCGGLMNDGDCCLDDRRHDDFLGERVVDLASDAFR